MGDVLSGVYTWCMHLASALGSRGLFRASLESLSPPWSWPVMCQSDAPEVRDCLGAIRPRHAKSASSAYGVVGFAASLPVSGPDCVKTNALLDWSSSLKDGPLDPGPCSSVEISIFPKGDG